MAKLSEAQFAQSITSKADIRLFLIFGQDESSISDIAANMCTAMGSEAERIDLSSDQIRRDPAILADEAGAIGLFGDKRYIRLHIAREEGLSAIENLLEAEQAGNPVIATAGDLKKTSKIRKLAESSPLAMTHICYPMDEPKMAAAIQQMAKAAGLRLDRALAQRMAASSNCDRKLAASEIEKLALYYDAEPSGAVEVERDIFDALSAANDEENINALVNYILGGKMKQLGVELLAARQTGILGIALIRSMQRRLAMLIGLRSKADGGQSISNLANSPAIFWKDRDAVAGQLSRWPSVRLAALNGHLLEVEKKLMSVKSDMTEIVLEQELTRIARVAANSR